MSSYQLSCCKWFMIVLISWLSSAGAATINVLPPSAPQPTVTDQRGQKHQLYRESHALLISSSKYTGKGNGGWPRLEGTHAEMTLVAKELQKHGFQVIHVLDPTSDELNAQISSFFASYGHDPDNRLLFFFSGHGYTNAENGFGYIVPIDAKAPDVSPRDFYSKAIPITTLDVKAREITVRHALFLFDSCFSGSIFSNKALSRPDINSHNDLDRLRFFLGQSTKPVRQFIAAGSADEKLPERSIFIPLFLQALQAGISPQNDGYITAKEIGLWLEQTVPSFNKNQNPHSDVVETPRFKFGDMIFQLGRSSTAPDTALSSNKPSNKGYRDTPSGRTATDLGPKKGITATAAVDAGSTGTVGRRDHTSLNHDLNWMPLEKLTFPKINFDRKSVVEFPEAVQGKCVEVRLTPDGSRLIAQIKDGIGFFDAKSGQLLTSIVQPIPNPYSGECSTTTNEMFADGKMFLVKTAQIDLKDAVQRGKFWVVDLVSMKKFEITGNSSESLEMVVVGSSEEKILTLSTLYAGQSKQPLKKNEGKHSPGDIYIRYLNADGSIYKEKLILRDHTKGSLWTELHEMHRFDLPIRNGNLTNGLLLGRTYFISLTDIFDHSRFTKIMYKAIGCKEEPKYIITETNGNRYAANKVGWNMDKSGCIITSFKPYHGKVFNIPALVKERLTGSIKPAVNGKEVIMYQKDYDNYSIKTFRFDPAGEVGSSSATINVIEDVSSSGLSGVSWLRLSEASKTKLYAVRFDTAVF